LMRWALSQAWVNFFLAGTVQHCLDALHSETPMTSAFCVSLAGMVQHCLDALGFESGLGEAWVGVSLEWALHAHNRHLACRSQQVR
jgi:hypothetical protein